MLLLNLWRGEEALRGMTDAQGVIYNTARPLADELCRELGGVARHELTCRGSAAGRFLAFLTFLQRLLQADYNFTFPSLPGFGTLMRHTWKQ